MKIALFSDIHANLPALEAVLNDIATQNVDAVYCLGDLVGYAPFANEVVERIRSLNIATIAGNYDDGVGRNSDDCGCAYKTERDREMGRQSINYTNAIITEHNRNWLRNLPATIDLKLGYDDDSLKISLVHGSPRRINEYLFEDRNNTSLLRLMSACDIMCCGHTHKPYHRLIADEAANRWKLIVNIGSVGKPKDGNPDAAYVILHLPPSPLSADLSAVRVELRRVQYDVEAVACAIEAGPLPNEYAEMLRRAF